MHTPWSYATNFKKEYPRIHLQSIPNNLLRKPGDANHRFGAPLRICAPLVSRGTDGSINVVGTTTLRLLTSGDEPSHVDSRW